MAVKLGDIAKKAGVSLTTVSRVINMDKNISVSKETEEKIWMYAQTMGYKTNKNKSLADNGKKKKTASIKNIGYILTLKKENFEDSFFSKVIHGIEQELIEQRHNLAFAYTAHDMEDQVVLNNILNSECDGCLIVGTIPFEYYSLLIDRIPNCVAIFDVPEEKIIDCITVEHEKYAYSLVRMMIEAGHRNIAFIGGTGYHISPEIYGGRYFNDREERFQGYIKALLESDIKINFNIIKDGSWDIEVAYRKMREILDGNEKITAVFAATDRMAIGAMRAIQERGMTIPEDISVVGFDDIEIAKYLNPALTTVYYPKEEIGRYAVKVLLDRIASDSDISRIPKKIMLPSNIVERDSLKSIKDI